MARNPALDVLLVEDNPGDARLVREMLAEVDDRTIHVTTAGSLADGKSKAQAEAFDVILLDLGLPDSQGLATVEAMIEAVPGIPVVVLTGLADEQTGLQAVDAGGQDYLVKGDADGRLLQRTLRFALQRHEAEREVRESRERFRSLVDVAPEGIILVDADGIQFANPAAADLVGSDAPGNLTGQRLTDFFTVAGEQVVAEALDTVLNGNRAMDQCVETRLARPDGRTVDVEVRGVPVAAEGRNQAQFLLRDITARKEAERYQRMATAVFETAAEAMMMTDADGVIVAVNPAFTEITGYPAEEAVGQTPGLLSSGRHGPDFFAEMYRTVDETGHWRGDVWNRRRNGEVYVQRLTVTAIYDDAGSISNYVGVFSDVTEERQQEDRMFRQANFDALTGLPNRVLLQDRLGHAVVEAARDRQRLAVLFVDLDGFKDINDTHGHLVGDRLLQEMAHRLRNCVRASDTVARLGGDEFLVVLRQVQRTEDARTVARSILASVSESVRVDQLELEVGCSIGIALFPQHGPDAETLIDRADRAMYRAKNHGKGNWRVYDDHSAVAV